jgi:hypothetical protein
MKKIVCALVVLALAMPASAAVNITIEQDVAGEPNATISYECTGGDIVRCFGLDIQLDNDETIVAVECLSDDYYLNPQKFTYDGVTPNFGDTPCLCDADSGLLAGLDSNGITIAMCSLYADDDPDHNVPPATSNGLVRITLSGSACVTITENSVLPGVLKEDNSPANPTLPDPCCIDAGCQCMGDICDSTTLGPPDGTVNIGDLNKILIEMLTAYPTGDTAGLYDLGGIPVILGDCADVCDSTTLGPPDGTVDIGDLNKILIAMLTAYPTGDTAGLYDLGGCLP